MTTEARTAAHLNGRGQAEVEAEAAKAVMEARVRALSLRPWSTLALKRLGWMLTNRGSTAVTFTRNGHALAEKQSNPFCEARLLDPRAVAPEHLAKVQGVLREGYQRGVHCVTVSLLREVVGAELRRRGGTGL